MNRAQPPRDEAPLAGAAADLLRTQLDRTVPLPHPGERAQGIAALEEALRQRARRRRGRWAAWAAVSVASAAAASAILILRPAPPPIAHVAPARPAIAAAALRPMTVGLVEGPRATIAHAGAERPAEVGATVQAGDTIVQPPGGSFVATLGSGARLTLREGPLDLVEAGARERMRLRAGAVKLSVPKLGPDRRLIVDTPDAEVEVRGTRFAVAVGAADDQCGDGTTTRVSVEEGVVVVRHDGIESRVAGGQHWPVCAPRAPVPAPHHVARAAVRAAAAPIVREAAEPVVATSTLAEQNDLFAAAVGARRRGQTDQALRLIDDLLRRFPDGPLAAHAQAERVHLLAEPGQDR